MRLKSTIIHALRGPLARPRFMDAINRALGQASCADTAVPYVDDVGINLNPKLGTLWCRRGEQVAIPAPGKNR